MRIGRIVVNLHTIRKVTTGKHFPLLWAKLRKMIETLLLTVLIIAIAAILLGVKVIFRRNGSFSSMHIHDSEAMRQRGIHCVMEQDREQRQKQRGVREKSH